MPAELSDNIYFLLAFGLAIGIFSGIMGLGGGAIIVPIMVLVFGLGQKEAHGTSLGMILSPFSAPAIYNYAKEGFVEWRFVFTVAPGMFVGSYFGSLLVTQPWLKKEWLTLAFGFVLVYVASYMIFTTVTGGNIVRTVSLSGAITGMALALFIFSKLMGWSSLETLTADGPPASASTATSATSTAAADIAPAGPPDDPDRPAADRPD
ncbi:MAG: sulfite exporter TauE/SafE family protein [Phycisphaerae bacterium]